MAKWLDMWGCNIFLRIHCKYKGVPTEGISEALGHKSEAVTQIYLDSFDKEV
jgi:hypothetical protein